MRMYINPLSPSFDIFSGTHVRPWVRIATPLFMLDTLWWTSIPSRESSNTPSRFMLGTLWWTSIPSRESSNTPSRFMLGTLWWTSIPTGEALVHLVRIHATETESKQRPKKLREYCTEPLSALAQCVIYDSRLPTYRQSGPLQTRTLLNFIP